MFKKCCDTCQYNFGEVCVSHGFEKHKGRDLYGIDIEVCKRLFPEGCCDYRISFFDYVGICRYKKRLDD